MNENLELEPATGDKPLYWPQEWAIYRNSHQPYPDGEYEPSDSWSGEKAMNPWEVDRPSTWTYWDWGLGGRSRSWDTRIIVKVHVYGKRTKTRRLVPGNWWCRITMGNHSLDHPCPPGHKSARTLAQIQRMVDKMDFTEEIAQLQKSFYSPRAAICVYRRDESGGYVPFCTLFTTNSINQIIPAGDYITVQARRWVQWHSRPPDELEVSHWRLDGYGYSAGGELERPAPPHWIPEEYVEEARNRVANATYKET